MPTYSSSESITNLCTYFSESLLRFFRAVCAFGNVAFVMNSENGIISAQDIINEPYDGLHRHF